MLIVRLFHVEHSVAVAAGAAFAVPLPWSPGGVGACELNFTIGIPNCTLTIKNNKVMSMLFTYWDITNIMKQHCLENICFWIRLSVNPELGEMVGLCTCELQEFRGGTVCGVGAGSFASFPCQASRLQLIDQHLLFDPKQQFAMASAEEKWKGESRDRQVMASNANLN